MTTPNRQVPTVIKLSSEQASEPSRRQFCAHACQAASLVAVSALVSACGGGDDGNPTNPSGGGQVSWDLRNRSNQFVGSGVYFFHVSLPDGRKHIGRFTVINSAK